MIKCGGVTKVGGVSSRKEPAAERKARQSKTSGGFEIDSKSSSLSRPQAARVSY